MIIRGRREETFNEAFWAALSAKVTRLHDSLKKERVRNSFDFSGIIVVVRNWKVQ